MLPIDVPVLKLLSDIGYCGGSHAPAGNLHCHLFPDSAKVKVKKNSLILGER